MMVNVVMMMRFMVRVMTVVMPAMMMAAVVAAMMAATVMSTTVPTSMPTLGKGVSGERHDAQYTSQKSEVSKSAAQFFHGSVAQAESCFAGIRRSRILQL